jgi:uncharacterized cupredoxin-like copper-binding protein
MLSAAFRLACAALGGVSVVAAVGCASSHSAGTSGAKAVQVTVRDFRISAPKHLKAGTVQLSVHNKGPDAHELILIRANGPLPMRSDGTTVDEDAVEPSTAGALEPEEPNSVSFLTVHLTPGHYEFICNMAGHYLGGMRSELIVE